MRVKNYYLISIFTVAAYLTGSMIYAPSVSAAQDGENGPIVYTENIYDVKGEDSVDIQGKVVTTSQDGSNEQVVAETENPISAAGISGPTAENNHDIAYGEVSEAGCVGSSDCTATVSKVTTDKDGIAVGSPTELAKLDSLVDGKSENRVGNLSYSPDGKTVLATQYSDKRRGDDKSAVIAIDNDTGATSEVVAPREDPHLNAGYADDGTIYYSRTNKRGNVDIWYIKKDNPTPERLTKTRRINEFFLDVSPDNKSVLVVDVNSESCYYSYGMYASLNLDYNPYCDYYLVSTADGSISTISGLPEEFVPAYFSPDNTKLIGTRFAGLTLARSFNISDYPSSDVTATFDLNTHELAMISERIGVQQWAPRVEQTTVENETKPGMGVVVNAVKATKKVQSKTVETLPATGDNMNILVYSMIVLLIASAGSIWYTFSNRK